MRCFHVTTEQGARYGAAAQGKREAKQLVQARISREDADAVALGFDPTGDQPATAEDMGPWRAVEYGTVVCYDGPREN